MLTLEGNLARTSLAAGRAEVLAERPERSEFDGARLSGELPRLELCRTT
jgi:hypothetical protein